MVGEAHAYVQGESLKVCAALLTEASQLPDHQVGGRSMYFLKFVLLMVIGAACLFVAADLMKDGSVATAVSQPPAPQPNQPAGIIGSPVEQYISQMLEFQYYVDMAFHAGICRLRGEAYMQTFRAAQSRLSIETANRLRLSNNEVSRADIEVNRRFAKAREGVPDFDLVRGCAYMKNSPRMVQLDQLFQNFSGR
jgi:hypothetical protein